MLGSYKQIYEQYNSGSLIPGIEIHHIDGNHSNNNPDNLQAVTLQEHFDIHYKQGDWKACQAILIRMDYSLEMLKEISRRVQLERYSKGTHNFQLMSIQRRTEISKKTIAERIASGNGAFILKDTVENSRYAGRIAKQKNAGFHNPDKTGGVFVRNTHNNITGERKRCKESPGENWKRGMNEK